MKIISDVTNNSIAQLISLSGRGAVVTGGGRGLGKAIAHRLAEAGAKVLIADIDGNLAQTAAEDLSSTLNAQVIGTSLDVADSSSVAAVADMAVREFGTLDIWVNNAGIFPCVPLDQMTDELWNSVMAVNTRGVMVGTREAARCMKAADKGGVVVNVVSTAGFKGVSPGLSAYVASKHAVRGMTKQAALELAPAGIRVLGVAPTYCVTEGNLLAAAQHPAPPPDVNIAAMVGSKLGRVGVPDDIARVALFCASDLSLFMTGSTLLADAGETI